MAVAKQAVIIVDGADLACALKEVKFSGETEALDSTTLCMSAKAFEAGLQEGSLSMEGLFKNSTGVQKELDDVLGAAFGPDSPHIISVSRGPIAIGSPAVMMRSDRAKYEVSSKIGELVMATAEVKSKVGFRRGVWLFSGTNNATNIGSTGLDNGVSTTGGGYFHAHSLRHATLPAATDSHWRLQHSTDNSTWVDVLPLQSIGKESGAIFYEVPAGTTVQRYVRIAIQADGGAIEARACFSRR